MKVIYRSYDGLEFDTPEECVRHEQTSPRFKMYDPNGLTDNPDNAMLVWFSENVTATERFKCFCDEHEITTYGIPDCHTDFVYWDNVELVWRELPWALVDSVKRFLNDNPK